jgi:hypothetical protein
VSYADEEVNIGTQFIAVGAEYDKERGTIKDVNDFTMCNAYGVSSSSFCRYTVTSYPTIAMGKVGLSSSFTDPVWTDLNHQDSLINIREGVRTPLTIISTIKATTRI